MRRIKLTIEYDGTAYGGWQYQKNASSIQDELEKAIRMVTGESVRVHGAGRTDAGVHALGQVAHLDLGSDIPSLKLPSALNAHLPKDIAVAEAEEVSGDFHARYSAKGKIYRYRILNRRERGAVERDYAAHIVWDLDVDAMATAAGMLLGRHDFSAFATDLSGTSRDHEEEGKRPLDPVRTLRRLDICRGGRYLEIESEADGFLYNMARCIVGSLIEVGRGKQKPTWIADVLASCDRRLAGPTAPARGLCLMKVLY